MKGMVEGFGLATNGSDAEEQMAFAEYRAALYRAAADAFMNEPSDAALSSIAHGALMVHADEFVLACEGALLKHLAAYASENSGEAACQGKRVRTEYAELFVGPRAPLAPLYESIYVGYPRRLFSEVTESVRRAYEARGIAVAARNKIPDDHLSYEMQFMAELCMREMDAIAAHDDAETMNLRSDQKGFLNEHLALWLPEFTRRVSEAWCGDYYAAWAEFARDLVGEDIAYLDSLASSCSSCKEAAVCGAMKTTSATQARCEEKREGLNDDR